MFLPSSPNAILVRSGWLAALPGYCLLWLLGSLAPAAADAQTALSQAEAGAVFARDLATSQQAPLLAPELVEKAQKQLNKAQSLADSPARSAKAQKPFEEAESLFLAAAERAQQLSPALAAPLTARANALSVGADRLQNADWKAADKILRQAADAQATARGEKALQLAGEAEQRYRDLELFAIQHRSLTPARQQIAQALADKVDDEAPETLKRAQQTLLTAEEALVHNRYDSDYAESLAGEAIWQTQHATRLADRIRQHQARDTSLESLLLDSEKPLTMIASQLGIHPRFHDGQAAVTEDLIASIDSLQLDSQTLALRQQELQALSKEMLALEKRLGIQSQQLAEQEKQRARLAHLSGLFTTQEAGIFTQHRSVIFRAQGLQFAPGSSQLTAEHRAFLDRLADALRFFKGFSIRIEGHTDAFGTQEANQRLSQARAEAVSQFLQQDSIAAGELKNAFEAIGYGEDKPIASNDTPEGRSRNRRIDLVLEPARLTKP
jgi:OmpA-OmpF porin, OOP family